MDIWVNNTSLAAANAVISNNVFKFFGDTATHTLGIVVFGSSSSSARITHNTFMGNTTVQAADISVSSGGIYPTLGYGGPRGACNVGSSGDELPAF